MPDTRAEFRWNIDVRLGRPSVAHGIQPISFVLGFNRP